MSSFLFKSFIDKHYKLRMHYITVPSDQVKAIGGIGTRLICRVNDNPPFQCGLVALGGGAAYISLNKARLKSFGLTLGNEVQVHLELDQSKYGLEVPEELQALLEQDEEGAKLFDTLTDGQQRYIIYYVSQVKSSALKIDRAIMMIRNLKTMPEGPFSFRHLVGIPPRD
ncbi:YdeI/OmpD-associated family protein [Balneola vulgaris]|uniref:YdeI/OmpD-associated family protein n=1 Tax=Balneola vulgaris TaxID=287535 RepID=UPI0003808BE3|nr:YdeI/OmpD-associated family protein [Balneola vulgaris]